MNAVKPGWMLPLPKHERSRKLEGEVTRGALREETTRELDGRERGPSFVDQVEEAMLAEDDDAPIFDVIDDLEWPLRKQGDLFRGIAREIRMRDCGAERRREARGYPRGTAERIALHNARDYHGPGTLTEREWRAIVEAWECRCAYCKSPLNSPVIEHVRPVCLGGRTTLENIAPACFDCNASKRAKDPAVWLGQEAPAFFALMAANLARARRLLRSRRWNAKAP